MKFVVRMNGNTSVYLRGLRLLDMVRAIVTDIEAEDVVDSAYCPASEDYVLTEEQARRTGLFQDTNQVAVRLEITGEVWASLLTATQVKTDNWYSKVIPIVTADHKLLDAWFEAGCPTEFIYPPEEPQEDEEEESQE